MVRIKFPIYFPIYRLPLAFWHGVKKSGPFFLRQDPPAGLLTAHLEQIGGAEVRLQDELADCAIGNLVENIGSLPVSPRLPKISLVV